MRLHHCPACSPVGPCTLQHWTGRKHGVSTTLSRRARFHVVCSSSLQAHSFLAHDCARPVTRRASTARCLPTDGTSVMMDCGRRMQTEPCQTLLCLRAGADQHGVHRAHDAEPGAAADRGALQHRRQPDQRLPVHEQRHLAQPPVGAVGAVAKRGLGCGHTVGTTGEGARSSSWVVAVDHGVRAS